jgi:hypothetical protein
MGGYHVRNNFKDGNNVNISKLLVQSKKERRVAWTGYSSYRVRKLK